jgi:transposase InsO family protein
LDFITKLPTSKGNDMILTITNHDCSKAALFFTCKETITAEEVTELYAKYVFPHYGIPRKVISDRDPRFTTTLCEKLGIKQNLSTAYHSQTDGQSERTNQWLEQYLRIFGNYSQNDWANWLPLAQYVHNSWMNETTKQTPFNLLIGGLPVSHYPMTEERESKED